MHYLPLRRKGNTAKLRPGGNMVHVKVVCAMCHMYNGRSLEYPSSILPAVNLTLRSTDATLGNDTDLNQVKPDHQSMHACPHKDLHLLRPNK